MALMPPALMPMAVAWPAVWLASGVRSHCVGSYSWVKPPWPFRSVPMVMALVLCATTWPSRVIWGLRRMR
ncbi:hypothetical protein D3C71_1686130 [compost metagenome]